MIHFTILTLLKIPPRKLEISITVTCDFILYPTIKTPLVPVSILPKFYVLCLSLCLWFSSVMLSSFSGSCYGWRRFSQSTSIFPWVSLHQCSILIHLSLMLYNISNWVSLNNTFWKPNFLTLLTHTSQLFYNFDNI